MCGAWCLLCPPALLPLAATLGLCVVVLDRSRTAGLYPNGCSRSLVLPQLVVLLCSIVGVRSSGRSLGRVDGWCVRVCLCVSE